MGSSPRFKLPPRSVRLPSCSKSWIFSSPISPTGRTNTEKSASNSSRPSTKWPDTNQISYFLLDTNQIFFSLHIIFFFFFLHLRISCILYQHFTALYCAVLYCTVLYCTALY